MQVFKATSIIFAMHRAVLKCKVTLFEICPPSELSNLKIFQKAGDKMDSRIDEIAGFPNPCLRDQR